MPTTDTMDVSDVAGSYTSQVHQQTLTDASMAVLARTLKTETLEASGLIGSMPQLPPIGSLGQNIDVKA